MNLKGTNRRQILVVIDEDPSLTSENGLQNKKITTGIKTIQDLASTSIDSRFKFSGNY